MKRPLQEGARHDMTLDHHYLAGWREVRRVGIRTMNEVENVLMQIDPQGVLSDEERFQDFKSLIELWDQGVVVWDAEQGFFRFSEDGGMPEARDVPSPAILSA